MQKLINEYWGKFIDYLPNLLSGIIILIIGLILIKLMLKILNKGLSKSKVDKTAHGIIKSLTKIGLYVMLGVIVLTDFGVPTASLVALIGASGLAVGLAIQNSLSNLAGGFIVLFTKPFSTGDYIETNGVSGTVEEISVFSTKLLTVDNKVVYIPNGQVSNNKITNYTQEKLRRVDFNFTISYNDDYTKAISIISEIVSKHPLALQEPEPFIRMTEHAANSIVITARIWTNSEDYWTLNYDLIEEVKKQFDINGISIPYNQLDIHINK